MKHTIRQVFHSGKFVFGFCIFVGLLLVVNVAAGAYAVVRDWLDPFSASREVAEFIRPEGLTGLPIVGQRDVMAAVVSGYLGQLVFCAALDREIDHIPFAGRVRR